MYCTCLKINFKDKNMVVVQVVSQKTGQPEKGKKVAVSVSWGIMGGGVSKDEFTNSNGEATFSDIKPSSNGKIFINGNTVHDGEIQGFNRVFI
jgi:hypothetical protein